MKRDYWCIGLISIVICILIFAGFALNSLRMTDTEPPTSGDYIERQIFSHDPHYLKSAVGRDPRVCEFGDDDRWS